MGIASIIVVSLLALASLTLIVGAIIYGLKAPVGPVSQKVKEMIEEKEKLVAEDAVYKELVNILIIKEKEKTQ